ncbi:MAG: 5'/3'-nucleotidase SurE [Thermoanaerobaculales bacterium]|jgi:5'-nucleotidase|nr:5'/3'-nucleotidase SurE [Thermoanaerobaculales bacterium]
MYRLSPLLIGLVLLSGCAADIEAQTPIHVMVVNDDGIESPGLAAVAAVLAADPAYRITVVAPAEQQSGVGHALTIRREMAVRPHADIGGAPAWSVTGTPASVTGAGLTAVLADDLPKLVVSGINKGENLGRAAWYSGTIGGAREAVMRGIPAVALSLELDWSNPEPDWTSAARFAKPIIDAVRDHPLPPGTLLNVNFPRATAAARGYRVTRLGLEPDSVSRYEVDREEDGVRFVSSRWAPPQEGAPGTDIAAIADGWIPITPLSLDQTAYEVLPELIPLDLRLPDETAAR